jgi:hypothetical protein
MRPRRSCIPPGPVTLLSVEVRDWAIRDLIETTSFVDENGEPVIFDALPVIGDEHDDDE